MPALRILDVKCDACAAAHPEAGELAGVEQNVALTREEPIPACPTCGGARHTVWLPSGRGSYDAFVPFDYDDVHYSTRAEWEAYKKDLAAAHPGATVEEEGNNRTRSKARADDLRQAYYDRVRSKGIDEQVVRERQRENLARRREREGR